MNPAGAAEFSNPPALITPSHAQQIYRRVLKMHWVSDTGLFLSFPDSSDHRLSQQASVYEQGAMGLLALRVGDNARARALFDFLRTAWVTGPNMPERRGARGLGNFYNGYFGSGGIEETIHLGPNAWVGLFAARYANATHDTEALQWALDVAYWVANDLPHRDGAAAMGARDEANGPPWAHIFSTENNISYYAMLSELLRSSSLDSAQRAALSQEREHVLSWLVNKAYDRRTGKINRGYNPQGADPIQALDTTTWLLCALGPRALADHGIDPDQLMSRAAKAYEVTVNGIQGVDASDQDEADWIYMHLHGDDGQPARPAADHHRLIWYEGLGQYIVALLTMADDRKNAGDADGATRYLAKAEQFSQSFDRAALKHAPGQAAYPYATAGRFFRDGWTTQAQSAQGPAASLIAATWRCFAGLGWDPLGGRALRSASPVSIKVPVVSAAPRAKPAILYGTSEQMVVNAWRAIESQKWDAAIEQADATIDEWSPWASRLEQKKAREIGRLVPYDGNPDESKKIFDYWALNDVGAAYFVLGKAYDAKGDYAKAAAAFKQVLNNYPLAQVWDPKGWFWSPTEAIQSDFIQRDPEHYGGITSQA